MSNTAQSAFAAWAAQQNPPYELHVRPVAQQRGPMNVYSNQRTQHTFEGFAGACNSHDQLVAALREIAAINNPRVCLDGSAKVGSANAVGYDFQLIARAALAAAEVQP